jgi:hypothetical protein
MAQKGNKNSYGISKGICITTYVDVTADKKNFPATIMAETVQKVIIVVFQVCRHFCTCTYYVQSTTKHGF